MILELGGLCVKMQDTDVPLLFLSQQLISIFRNIFKGVQEGERTVQRCKDHGFHWGCWSEQKTVAELTSGGAHTLVNLCASAILIQLWRIFWVSNLFDSKTAAGTSMYQLIEFNSEQRTYSTLLTIRNDYTISNTQIGCWECVLLHWCCRETAGKSKGSYSWDPFRLKEHGLNYIHISDDFRSIWSNKLETEACFHEIDFAEQDDRNNAVFDV